MPRKPRLHSSTGIYHIILRSVNQHIIFEEESDYQKFLFMLSDCKTKYNIDIYAYCIMDNHIHLLLHSSDNHLACFFQSLGTRFVRWYNNKYLRSGHLFQERFYSCAVENKSQYLSTLVYIHNNPVKAKICRYPSEYRWSSFNAFFGAKNPIVNIAFSYKEAGSKESLLHYFSTADNSYDETYFVKDHRPTNHYLTDEKALSVFKEITNLSCSSEVVNLNKSLRNQFIRRLKQEGLTYKQVARLMDVSLTTVNRICKIDH